MATDYETKIAQATAFSQGALDAALGLVGSADAMTGKGPRDPEVVALTILCRSISNFHAIMILVQNQGVVEGRALVRLMYENVLWISALQERGADFVKDMLADEAHNRKTLAQLTFSLGAKNGADSNSEDALHLRTLLQEMDKQFPTKKKLSAAAVAASGRVETAYFEYGRFSLDAVHCSVTALGRHIEGETVDGNRELMINVVPNTPPREVLSTIVSACRALIYAMVGAGGLLGLEDAGVAPVLAEFEAASWDQDTDEDGVVRAGV